MLTAIVLILSQTVAATPAPAPKLGGGFGQPKPTASQKAKVVIDETTLAPAGTGRGTLSVGGVPWQAIVFPTGRPEDPGPAQRRMEAAVQNEAWNAVNLRYNWRIVREGQLERDAAVEACRKTVGCVPFYR